MKKAAIIISILLIVISLCSCAQNDTPEAYAKDFITACSKTNYQDATKNFDDTYKTKMTADKVKNLWEYCIKNYGAFSEVTGTTATTKDTNTTIATNCLFAKGTITINITFNSNKKIIGITSDFVIATDSPKAPTGVLETDLKVNAGTQWELGGTLSYFQNKTDGVTGVVLVGGSGAMTRNETIGSQNLYRDLAWGLSSRGVAVLRYDKRTYTYKDKITETAYPNFTVKDEIIDDAVQAVKALKSQTTVKVNKIYIVGHSLSASLLARIAKEVPDASGYVFMSAFSTPLEDLIYNQYAYIYNSNPNFNQADKDAALKPLKTQVENIKSLTKDSTFTAADLLGSPKSYWLDLKDYKPAEAVKDISKPMLFLQGEKDYQVTMADFNAFKSALTGRLDAKFISYPTLNYMYTLSEGTKALPSDYDNKLNMDQTVINDIYSFIK